VVVVLPASMCAMMPMLRTLLQVGCDVECHWGSRFEIPGGPRGSHGASGRIAPQRSPAVVGEGLVGLGHLVGVLALLHAGAEAVAGVEDLVHQALAMVFSRRARE
jgi:hypothetical protein